jgi:hypothetical protein
MEPIGGASLNYTNWKFLQGIHGLWLAWGAGNLQFDRAAAFSTLPAA